MKKYLLYDGERFVKEMSFAESVKESGVSKPTFTKILNENYGVFQKNNFFIIKKGSKPEIRAKTDEFREIVAARPTSDNFKEDLKLEKAALDKLLPEVKNFYKKISLTL